MITKKQFHKACKQLLETVESKQIFNYYTVSGICYNLEVILRDYHIHDKIRKYSQTWEHFSGDNFYPVPGGEAKYYSVRNHWTGKYGKLRIDLLKHLIKCSK